MFKKSLIALFVLALVLTACATQRATTAPSMPQLVQGAATTTAQQPQSTQAPTSTTVQPTPTQLLLQQTPTVLPLIGPVSYPTPQAEIIPWEQLINQTLIQNVSWSQYQGEIQANEKGLLWPYTFQYPSD
ncbi:MAG: hypothetical protein IMZ61_11460 [Planctomycetes bacterium]|nr:hypothetical protein [Planctomycetota bacterium]